MIPKSEKALRQDIMLAIKANGIPITGDFWFWLILRTREQLVKIAQDMHISTDTTGEPDGPETDSQQG